MIIRTCSNNLPQVHLRFLCLIWGAHIIWHYWRAAYSNHCTQFFQCIRFFHCSQLYYLAVVAYNHIYSWWWQLFFLLKSHPETFSWLSLYLETPVSSECLRSFFFLKHEELSPLAVMGRINREGHFSLTDNHHYGKGPNTYDKLFAVWETSAKNFSENWF